MFYLFVAGTQAKSHRNRELFNSLGTQIGTSAKSKMALRSYTILSKEKYDATIGLILKMRNWNDLIGVSIYGLILKIINVIISLWLEHKLHLIEIEGSIHWEQKQEIIIE